MATLIFIARIIFLSLHLAMPAIGIYILIFVAACLEFKMQNSGSLELPFSIKVLKWCTLTLFLTEFVSAGISIPLVFSSLCFSRRTFLITKYSWDEAPMLPGRISQLGASCLAWEASWRAFGGENPCFLYWTTPSNATDCEVSVS